MRIERMRAFAAGNHYARRPVIELELGEDMPGSVPDPAATILAIFPPLRRKVLDFPAWARLLAASAPAPTTAVVEVLAVVMQRFTNWPVRFCADRRLAGDRRRRAIFEAGSRTTAIRAGRIAVEIAEAMLSERSPEEMKHFVFEKLNAFFRKTHRETPAGDTLSVAASAAARRIPWCSLPRSPYLRLGQGQHARVLLGSEAPTTSLIGMRLARQKDVASGLLRNAGLPVPEQRSVRKVEDALQAARSIGFPVVVKPVDGNMGKGVSVGIKDEDQLALAFAGAQAISREVIVEAHVPGDEHRLLVIGGKFVAAARRRPAQVTGDGKSTIRALVEAENARPERSAILRSRMVVRCPLEVDPEAESILRDQDLTPESVPEAGRVALLRRVSNVSRGGDTVDVTDRVHASIRALAMRVAAVLGLDLCGIDFITTDISRSIEETGGAICEVNTRPGLTIHLVVAEGEVRDVAGQLVEALFPEESPVRIPTVAVMAEAYTPDLLLGITAAAASEGIRLGIHVPDSLPGASPLVETGEGVAAGARRLRSAEAAAWDEGIDAALVVLPARVIARRGLGLERIDLAVVPSRAGRGALARATAALARAASRRVATPEDPDMLILALKALELAGPQRKRRLLRTTESMGPTHSRPVRAGSREEPVARPAPAHGGMLELTI